MKTRIISIIVLGLSLLIPLSGEIIKQQSFEQDPTDTWGYSLTPNAYYHTSNYSIWDRDNDILDRLLPLPDEDGQYLFVMENTDDTNTELHRFIFDTVDLSSYTGNLSAHFYYYTFYYNTYDGSWSGTPDSLGYYVEYDNGTDWNSYIPLNMGTNEWTQINIDIPDTAQYFRLSIVGKNSVWQEIGAFDYVYLLEEIGEPTNHVSDLAVSSTTDNTITVTWNDNDGAQPAENFLIKIAQGASPVAPSDGTEEHPSATVKQIASGTQTCTFTGLNPSTSYTISVFPYTNLDILIDYKTDGTVPTVTTTTQDTPTPICLSNFTAQPQNNGILLSWETASETENSGFILYRDDDPITFIEGAGTSSGFHQYSYLDKDVIPGVSYTYILADLSYDNHEVRYNEDAITIAAKASSEMIGSYIIEHAYPNPFNPYTTVDFTLNEADHIGIMVYNTSGEKVAELFNGNRAAGSYSLKWNANTMMSGVYFLKISIGNNMETQKLLLLK